MRSVYLHGGWFASFAVNDPVRAECMYFICTLKFYWQKMLQREFIFLSHCKEQLMTHREFGRPFYLLHLLIGSIFAYKGRLCQNLWAIPHQQPSPSNFNSTCKQLSTHMRCYSTWRFCLCRTWWWAALPAARRPTSEPRYGTAPGWFLLQTRSLFGGALDIFSLCACCCSLHKITRMAIINCF